MLNENLDCPFCKNMFLFLFYTEGFIVLAIESFWTRLFSQYFVCSEDETRDDLLFYVRGKSSNKDGKVDKDHQEVRSGSCYRKKVDIILQCKIRVTYLTL